MSTALVVTILMVLSGVFLGAFLRGLRKPSLAWCAAALVGFLAGAAGVLLWLLWATH